MTWGAVIFHDDQPVTGLVPVDDWTAGAVMAEVFAAWLGGPVSLAAAVIANQPKAEPELTLFEEVA